MYVVSLLHMPNRSDATGDSLNFTPIDWPEKAFARLKFG